MMDTQLKSMSIPRASLHILDLPIEIRNEIYSCFLNTEETQLSWVNPIRRDCLPRSRREWNFPVDEKCQFPYLPSLKGPSRVCRQMRYEFFEYAAAKNSHPDKPTVLFLDVLVPMMTAIGAFCPKKTGPSNTMLTFRPLFERLKRIRFSINAGSDWWDGTRPAAVNDSLNELLPYLKSIEEMEVISFIHLWGFWAWSLEEDRTKLVRPFLDKPLHRHNGEVVKKAIKKLVIVDENFEGGQPFFRKVETLSFGSESIEVSEETAVSAQFVFQYSIWIQLANMYYRSGSKRKTLVKMMQT